MSVNPNNYKTVYEFYKTNKQQLKENFDFNQLIDYDNKLATLLPSKNIIPQPLPIINHQHKAESTPDTHQHNPVHSHTPSELKMKYEIIEGNGTSPDIFGPPFWFTLHNSSNKYVKTMLYHILNLI